MVREQPACFYWTDIEGARLWRYDPSDGRSISSGRCPSVSLPSRCAPIRTTCCSASRRGSRSSISRQAETRHIVDVEPGLNTRANDGRCDRAGPLWCSARKTKARRAAGDRRVLPAQSRFVAGASAVARACHLNSIAFSPDGATMYYLRFADA